MQKAAVAENRIFLAVVAVYAYKSNFLKSASSGEATSKVRFETRSRDALINIKY